MLELSEFFVLNFYTDHSVGNFELEARAVAYATGMVGESGIGQEQADLFRREVGENLPLDIVSSDSIFNDDLYNNFNDDLYNKQRYASFCIFFEEEPVCGVRRLVIDRMIDYLDTQGIKVNSVSGYKHSTSKERELCFVVEVKE